ncbi:hypothetical protein M9H77_30705 [Catharanthus roseus]|uniref:Uncharacterized protein n=1 Tax=Catharanthus roseus TaxID=4058 RepID=A0ACB9ZXZ4_CATRO|nr:hypothetical protein M9H77_30705 [Catharanthus roseus]
MEFPEELLQENVGFQHVCPDGQKYWATFAQNGKGCGSLLSIWTKSDEDPNMFEEFLEPDEYIDLGYLFTTDKIFSSKDELVDWAKQTAKKAKIYLIINRYQRSRIADRRLYVTYSYERGGAVKKYKKPVVDDEEEEIPIKRRGPYGTKKIHAQAARLTDEQLQQTEKFKKSHVPPRNIYKTLVVQLENLQCCCEDKEEPDAGKEVEEVLCLSAQRGYTVLSETVKRATYLVILSLTPDIDCNDPNVAIYTYNGYHA